MSSKPTKPRTRPSQLKEIPPPPAPWRGSRVWSTKFSEDDIRVIRRMHMGGWGIKALADKYGTTWITMSRIVKGETWKHVDTETSGSKKT